MTLTTSEVNPSKMTPNRQWRKNFDTKD